ncbi:hypothetical protein EDD22DRAFT_780982, partial [Suillus occidentalis]
TGHAPLNKHLHHIAKVLNLICQQCQQCEEIIYHFIITCPQYTRQCHIFWIELGLQTNHLKNLLNNPKYIEPLLHFIASTCRMEQIFGNIISSVDEEDKEE